VSLMIDGLLKREKHISQEANRIVEAMKQMQKDSDLGMLDFAVACRMAATRFGAGVK